MTEIRLVRLYKMKFKGHVGEVRFTYGTEKAHFKKKMMGWNR